jgi:cell division protein FtsL
MDTQQQIDQLKAQISELESRLSTENGNAADELRTRYDKRMSDALKLEDPAEMARAIDLANEELLYDLPDEISEDQDADFSRRIGAAASEEEVMAIAREAGMDLRESGTTLTEELS